MCAHTHTRYCSRPAFCADPISYYIAICSLVDRSTGQPEFKDFLPNKHYCFHKYTIVQQHGPHCHILEAHINTDGVGGYTVECEQCDRGEWQYKTLGLKSLSHSCCCFVVTVEVKTVADLLFDCMQPKV